MWLLCARNRLPDTICAHVSINDTICSNRTTLKLSNNSVEMTVHWRFHHAKLLSRKCELQHSQLISSLPWDGQHSLSISRRPAEIFYFDDNSCRRDTKDDALRWDMLVITGIASHIWMRMWPVTRYNGIWWSSDSCWQYSTRYVHH